MASNTNGKQRLATMRVHHFILPDHVPPRGVNGQSSDPDLHGQGRSWVGSGSVKALTYH